MYENYSLKSKNVTLNQNLKILDMNFDNLSNNLDIKCKDISQLQLMITNLKQKKRIYLMESPISLI